MNAFNWLRKGFIGFIVLTLLAIATVNAKERTPPAPEKHKEVTESVQSDDVG